MNFENRLPGSQFRAVTTLYRVEEQDEAYHQSFALDIGDDKARSSAHFGYLHEPSKGLHRILSLPKDAASRHSINPPTDFSISQER